MPGPQRKTCECRLIGNGVDLHIADVTLEAHRDTKWFAKRAFNMASGSLRKLELSDYRIAVHDGQRIDHYPLVQLKDRKTRRQPCT